MNDARAEDRSIHRNPERTMETAMPSRYRFMPRCGFSLVELLIVITVISVLAAMLLPTMERAIGESRTVACINNERQLFMSFQYYCTAYRDYLPRWSSIQWEWWNGSYSNQLSWHYFMREELSPAVEPNGATSPYPMLNYRFARGSFLFCPSDPAPLPTATASLAIGPASGGTIGSYGMNAYGIGSCRYGSLSTPKRYRRMGDLVNPSAQVGFGDIFWELYPTGGYAGSHFPYGSIRYGHAEQTTTVFCDGRVGTFDLFGIRNLDIEANIPNPANRTDYNLTLSWFKYAPWGNP